MGRGEDVDLSSPMLPATTSRRIAAEMHGPPLNILKERTKLNRELESIGKSPLRQTRYSARVGVSRIGRRLNIYNLVGIRREK